MRIIGCDLRARQQTVEPFLTGKCFDFVSWIFQVAGASIQLKGRIRRIFASDAFPCQPQLAYGQDRFSFPNNFIASVSDSDTLAHFFCRLMVWPAGHSKTIR
jgi:hypothetical protein